MSLGPEIRHPGGSAYPGVGSPQIMCPACHSQQFFGEKRMSGLGWTLFWIGLVMMVISLLLMLAGVGFCTIIPSFMVMGISPLFRKYVNVCANCKSAF